MVWGVVLADGAYIAVSLLGMAKLLEIMVLKKAVLWVGATVLIYFGLRHLAKHGNEDDHSIADSGEENSFTYGFKLTMTNPLTIVFWSGVFGTMAAGGQLRGFSSIMLYGAGCLLSTLLFLTLVSLGGHLVSPILTHRGIRKKLDWGVGLFLIFFGVKMALS